MPITATNKTLVEQMSDAQAMKNAAADTSSLGSQTESLATTFGDDIMKAVREDRQSRGMSNIATQVGATMGQLSSDPDAIRSRTSATGLVAPSTVNQLTSSARALNLKTLGEEATQQKLNQGSLDQIIQAGANTLKSKAQQLYAQAEQEEAKANALMETLKFKADEEARAFDEWLAKEKLKDSGSGDISKLFDLGEDDGFIEDTDPQMTPSAGEGTISPDRKYIYKNGAWEPYKEPGFLQSFLSSLFSPKIQTPSITSPNIQSGNYLIKGEPKLPGMK